MNEKVKKYVDNLFADISDSKQLRELKEEVNANLLEKINDLVAQGQSAEEAFKNAIAELGDISELADSMRQATNTKIEDSMLIDPPIDRKHVFGYVIASTVILIGLMIGGVVQLKFAELFMTIATLLPFVIISVMMFVFFGLTQESRVVYGMQNKRALAYSIATGIMLFGIMTAGIVYLQGNKPFVTLSVLIPFVIPSVAIYIYLGLTEKSRMKGNEQWAKEWMEKWTTEWQYNYNSQHSMVRGGISGALWLFSTAIFFLVGLNGGWRYSWIVFIFAAGIEALMEAIFASKRS